MWCNWQVGTKPFLRIAFKQDLLLWPRVQDSCKRVRWETTCAPKTRMENRLCWGLACLARDGVWMSSTAKVGLEPFFPLLKLVWVM